MTEYYNPYNQVVEGNEFTACIKQAVLHSLSGEIEPIQARDLHNIVVRYGNVSHSYAIAPDKVHTTADEVRVEFPATLKQGEYKIWIDATYQGRKVAVVIKEAFRIVPFGCACVLKDGELHLQRGIYLSGSPYTDEELQRLKEEYLEKNIELDQAIKEYREKTESIEDIEGAKLAFNTMKRIQPYLYSIEYQSLNYEQARAHLLNAGVVPSACTTIRRGSEVGRNFDWNISHQVEFLVLTKAHNGRYATAGFCGSLPTLTQAVVESGEYREEYRYLPFYMQDGINEKGVFASIHQLPDNAERSQSAGGNTPEVDERERVSALMLVRYIVDNFKSAIEAANYIRDFVRVIPAKVGGEQMDFHYTIADKDTTVYLAFDGEAVYIEQHAAEDRFVLTNFRLAGTSLVDGIYNVWESGIEDYGQGIERANAALVSDLDMLSILAQEVNFTQAYTGNLRLTEFAGIEHDAVRATIRDTAALDAIQASAAALYQSEVSAGTLRENGNLWQSVHSVVYDLNAKTMRFLTQEIDGDAEPIVVDAFANEPAKQGNNPDATNTAILEAVNDIDVSGVVDAMLDIYADQIIAISGVTN